MSRVDAGICTGTAAMPPREVHRESSAKLRKLTSGDLAEVVQALSELLDDPEI